ncbi:TetR family transcriptional regulator [Parvibaculum sedimenti]|uniref:TetR family transcriptional regulator n=1 Tax=Parvibaculum sedimenti TaxID=2608632 RepID=A0A6N6VJK4_9HYPH|nr:TetR/AcrR family transcriptional regulator [Parvibaculum sedimenti]KAB7738673.1 TetR family transcriptional regulator [Parvibaculum sedimenti]
MPGSAAIRRKPTQERAKERVERILAAASELIAETGSDAVRMSEIAARAGVPIGSLYQYFPDKPAILRVLAQRVMERVREGLIASLTGLGSGKEAIGRVDALIEGYYQLFITEPDVRDVWSATQSDKALQALDVEDSRENARVFFASLKHLVPKRDHQRFEAASFLLMQLAGSAVRLAIAVDRREGDRLMKEYRAMTRRELETFFND